MKRHVHNRYGGLSVPPRSTRNPIHDISRPSIPSTRTRDSSMTAASSRRPSSSFAKQQQPLDPWYGSSTLKEKGSDENNHQNHDNFSPTRPSRGGLSNTKENNRHKYPSPEHTPQLSEGMLHIWVYQARHLVYRRLFNTMYEHHGLHVRLFAGSRTTRDRSDLFETNRNTSGTMANPRWRRSNEHVLERYGPGYFAIPLLRPSLRCDTELFIEIVCGIVVVAYIKVPLCSMVQDAERFESPHWFSCMGENRGLIELAFQWTPSIEKILEQDRYHGSNQEPEWNSEEEEEEMHAKSLKEEQLELQRQRLCEYEAYERRQQSESYPPKSMAGKSTNPILSWSQTSSSPSTSGISMAMTPCSMEELEVSPRVPESNNQCVHDEHSTIDNSIGSVSPTASWNSMSTVGISESAGMSPQERLLERQLWDLYRFGLSEKNPDDIDREMDVLSMASFAASTCASEVFTYNDRIQRMEEAILEARARQTEEGLIPSTSRSQSPSPLSETTSPKPGIVLFDPTTLSTPLPMSEHDPVLRAFQSENISNRRRSLPIDNVSRAERMASIMEEMKNMQVGAHRRERCSTAPLIVHLSRSTPQPSPLMDSPTGKKRSSLMNSVSDVLHDQFQIHNLPLHENQELQTQKQHNSKPPRVRHNSSEESHGLRLRRNSAGLNMVQVHGVTLGVGQSIHIGLLRGIIRYIGETAFASGIWIGIELHEPVGKHNGRIQNVEYFHCADQHGLFVRAERLEVANADACRKTS